MAAPQKRQDLLLSRFDALQPAVDPIEAFPVLS